MFILTCSISFPLSLSDRFDHLTPISIQSIVFYLFFCLYVSLVDKEKIENKILKSFHRNRTLLNYGLIQQWNISIVKNLFIGNGPAFLLVSRSFLFRFHVKRKKKIKRVIFNKIIFLSCSRRVLECYSLFFPNYQIQHHMQWMTLLICRFHWLVLSILL